MKDNKTLSTSRIFNGSIESVWKICSEINHLKNWWGPKGFSITNHLHEFKKEGRWSFIMHGPNGVDYNNELVYGEIEKFKKIEVTHVSMPKFTATILLHEVAENRIKLDFIQTFEDEKTCHAVQDFAISGNVEHQIRFETELSTLTGLECAKSFVIKRKFNADVAKMWSMFTTPSEMSKWYGPKETKTGHCDMDFRRGGHYHFSMIDDDGTESWGKAYYVDIVKNTRVIYVNTFSNRAGEITRHPMAPLIPLEFITIVSFKDEGESSEIEILWHPINATVEEIKFFNQMHESFKMGWTGSLDRLESLL